MRKLLLFAWSAIALVACSHDTTESPELGTKTIYATLASDDDSRVELNERKQTVWTAGDQIVVNGPDDMTVWQFNGQTGDRSGSFTYTGYFNFPNYSSTYQFDRYYAYLYDGPVTLGHTPDGVALLFMTARQQQTYKKGSYGVGDSPIIGTSDDGENFTFKNMLGYLRLSIKGNQTLESILFQGNNQEILAGTFYAPINDLFNTTWHEGQSTQITLDCGDGVQLTDTPTDFYIVLPPMTFEKGFSVTLNFTDGSLYPKSTSKEIVIERNAILPMATFDLGGEVDWQIATIYHTGTTVSAPLVGNGSGTIDWGEGTVSLLGELTSFTYTDGKPSHTITVKAINADQLAIDGCSGITKLDLSNF